MQKLTLLEINLGPGYYALCDVKRYGNLFNAASLVRDINDSGWPICVFKTLEIFQEEGKLCGIYCIRKRPEPVRAGKRGGCELCSVHIVQ